MGLLASWWTRSAVDHCAVLQYDRIMSRIRLQVWLPPPGANPVYLLIRLIFPLVETRHYPLPSTPVRAFSHRLHKSWERERAKKQKGEKHEKASFLHLIPTLPHVGEYAGSPVSFASSTRFPPIGHLMAVYPTAEGSSMPFQHAGK